MNPLSAIFGGGVALRNGDIMGVGAVVIDGVPRFVGRSRNTPETIRRAKVAHSRIPDFRRGALKHAARSLSP